MFKKMLVATVLLMVISTPVLANNQLDNLKRDVYQTKNAQTEALRKTNQPVIKKSDSMIKYENAKQKRADERAKRSKEAQENYNKKIDALKIK